MAAKRLLFLGVCPREELNLNLLLRRETSYPLNYEGLDITRARTSSCEQSWSAAMPLVYYENRDFVNGGEREDGRHEIKK